MPRLPGTRQLTKCLPQEGVLIQLDLATNKIQSVSFWMKYCENFQSVGDSDHIQTRTSSSVLWLDRISRRPTIMKCFVAPDELISIKMTIMFMENKRPFLNNFSHFCYSVLQLSADIVQKYMLTNSLKWYNYMESWLLFSLPDTRNSLGLNMLLVCIIWYMCTQGNTNEDHGMSYQGHAPLVVGGYEEGLW